MTAVVLVSQHAIVQMRAVGDRPVQLLQAQFLVAVILGALAGVLVVGANSLMVKVSYAVQLS